MSDEKEDKSRLTNEECDFIIRRILQKVRESVDPIDFFRGMGRNVVFEVSADNRNKVRELVRLFAMAE